METNENEIMIYSNDEFGEIGTIETENGQILFCGMDIAKALGYSNPRKAIADHCKEKGVTKRDTLTKGGLQKLTYIDEGNVYRLITHSKLPNAEQFESWVFDEVLPSIRKHGEYMTPETLERTIQDPDFIIGLAQALKSEQQKWKQLEVVNAEQKETIQEQAGQIQELSPKAEYCDAVLNADGLVSATEMAKSYGKTAIWLNKKLHELGIQYKHGKTWYLYQRYAQEGYTVTKTVPIKNKSGKTQNFINMYWTAKGRQFIYEVLKSQGILPLTTANLLTEQPERKETVYA